MVARRRSHAPRLVAMVFALVAGLAAALGATLSDAGAQTAPRYTFTKVADSAEDGFDPGEFGCAAINNRGDIAFRAGRPDPDGFNTIPGIYRADADGSLTTIAQNRTRFVFIGFNPSITGAGRVSFAATIEGGSRPDTESILRGAGGRLTAIATTKGRFRFFGFDTSINNSGEVAFKAELDNDDEGLFSGTGSSRSITTHYLKSTSDFDGSDSRPSINNEGDIAFEESIGFDPGIFVGRTGTFRTVAPPDPEVFAQKPMLNDAGTVDFQRSFFDEASMEFVEEIVTADEGGQTAVVADTRGGFSSFGFRPPSLNNGGDVAFLADLDDGTGGIFVGPDPASDRVIATGDTLDGEEVTNLRFCEEGLNDSGELAFVADFEDPETFEVRTAVYRANPGP